MNEFTRDFVAQTFTPQEQLYIRFATISIKKQLRKGISPICVRTDEVATGRFLKFLQKFYQNHIITDWNYRVKDTFSRVYTVVKNELSAIIEENELEQSDPSKTALTKEQARIFRHYAQEVWIPRSPKSFDVYLDSFGQHNTYFYTTCELMLNLDEIAKRNDNLKKLNQRIKGTKNQESICKCSRCNNTLPKEKIEAYADQFIDRFVVLDPNNPKDREELKAHLLDKR